MSLFIQILKVIGLSMKAILESVMSVLFNSTEVFTLIRKLIQYTSPIGVVSILLGVPIMIITIISILKRNLIRIDN